jgi:cysteine desulfurase
MTTARPIPGQPASLQPPAQPHPALTGGPVYLDYNATTPIDPRVAEAMRPALADVFGNPSSAHAYGPPARTALDRARTQVAALIRAGDPTSPGEGGRMVFTGSGSEADALAIRGSVLATLDADPARWTHRHRPQVITQATEHPADLAAAVSERTVLVTVMHANNETGTLQPVADLARIAHRVGALFHTDAAQTAGKISLDVAALDVDLLTLVGHKMYAPKGIAALYVRDGVRLEPIVGGGGQEAGVRAGTENLPHILALGAAAELAAADLTHGEPDRLTALRDRLHHALDTALPGRVHLNGHPQQRLPHTLNISISGTIGETLLATIPEIAASTGSACHSGRTDPSPVLTAVGLPREHALAALRLSLGRWTTPDQIDLAAGRIARAATG